MQSELIRWYIHNKRKLPFRDIRDPYKIWISEIMLQQTTVQAVIPYYLHFIEVFPDIKTLAKASLDDVYKCWEGLGYYSRAKHIYETAQVIHIKYHDTFPDDYNTILSLKGIGPYTAGAICSFAFNQSYGAIDGNALRVLSRVYRISDNIALNKTVNTIRNLANQLIVGYDSSSFNQGLMDLANAICKPLNPLCKDCPLNKVCKAYHYHEEKVLPINIKKIKKTETSYITGYITYQNKIMLIKNKSGLLENMYGLLQYEAESPYTFIEYFYNEYHADLTVNAFIKDFKHIFTHRTWYMHVYHFTLNKDIPALFSSYDTLTIPTAHKKILDYINKT